MALIKTHSPYFYEIFLWALILEIFMMWVAGAGGKLAFLEARNRILDSLSPKLFQALPWNRYSCCPGNLCMGSLLTSPWNIWCGWYKDRFVFCASFPAMFCYWEVEIIDFPSHTCPYGDQTFSLQVDLVLIRSISGGCDLVNQLIFSTLPFLGSIPG